MASNTNPSGGSRYLDPAANRQPSTLTPSRSAPQHSGSTAATDSQQQRRPILGRLRLGHDGGNNGDRSAINRQQSSIGLRRLGARPSRLGMNSVANDWQQQQNPTTQQSPGQQAPNVGHDTDQRRRSSSEPERPTWLAQHAQAGAAPQHLPAVPETSTPEAAKARGRRPSWLPRMPTRQQHNRDQQPLTHPDADQESVYDSNIVDLLDVVDPEVSTLTSITNLQNSLFVPSLGRFVNRRPTYNVSAWGPPPVPGNFPESLASIAENQQSPTNQAQRPSADRAYSITSEIEDSHYAVLPHGVSLEGWSKEEVDQLNDHVRHMLHSRRSKFKRGLKGFGSYVKRPLGFLVTLYATLITLFGLAWVLFLIGWINVGGKQLYLINIIDYTLVALFAIVGDGLAPFRAVDTYHMIFIAHYHRVSWKLREKLLLPELRDHNDLPTEAVLPDLESAHDTASIRSLAPGEEFSVLSPKQQERLTHHSTKYAKSHTFYRPHETETHYAFPLKLLVAITVLLDLHSCLQISLGSVTYGIPYTERPFALTTVILCCSITANATAGLLIWIGDKRTRKKDVIERMTRQELTEEAMNKVKKQNRKEAKEAEKAEAKKEGEQDEGRSSFSMPRLSLDKITGAVSKKGERSGPGEKNAIQEEET